MRDEELKPYSGDIGGDWPLDRDEWEVMHTMIKRLFRPANKRNRGYPLWSYVRNITDYGSGSATKICIWLGYDPDQCVLIRRSW